MPRSARDMFVGCIDVAWASLPMAAVRCGIGWYSGQISSSGAISILSGKKNEPIGLNRSDYRSISRRTAIMGKDAHGTKLLNLSRTALWCALLLQGCKPSEPPPKYLALGDSYTSGERVAADDRWPVQLAHQLKEDGIDLGEPQIIATTGWTTDELSAGIDQARLLGPYQLVTLSIGVNNQYRGRDAEEYRRQFKALLARAVGFAGGNARHVIVLSIPDWGVTPFADGQDRARIGSQIDYFNSINREETQKTGAGYVDVTPESRTATTRPSLIAGDGLHPSPLMYAEWVKLALPVAEEAIRK